QIGQDVPASRQKFALRHPYLEKRGQTLEALVIQGHAHTPPPTRWPDPTVLDPRTSSETLRRLYAFPLLQAVYPMRVLHCAANLDNGSPRAGNRSHHSLRRDSVSRLAGQLECAGHPTLRKQPV